jgi:predicted subunit of tRNA(5-methylaminomethyl-2-thiouridylate) methyltransferase
VKSPNNVFTSVLEEHSTLFRRLPAYSASRITPWEATMSNLDQRIRERAYQIWLEEGRPEGREKDHWDVATELVASRMDNRRRYSRLAAHGSKRGRKSEALETLQGGVG